MVIMVIRSIMVINKVTKDIYYYAKVIAGCMHVGRTQRRDFETFK